MIEFIRKIEVSLKNWKVSNSRKPLILRGARQVGKSYSIKHFGKKYYERVFEINFEQKPSFKKIFAKDLDPKIILSELSLHFGKEIHASKDLLFFDEIQECPQAITALRYFYEQTSDYHVIAAGSLLEFALDQISVPVGRLEYEYMYPLCFTEFLMATEREHLIPQIPHLKDTKRETLSQTGTELLYQAMKDYFIVGGMPDLQADYAA